MDSKEVRMRSIEAVSTMGIREPARLIRDAALIAEWVESAEDKAEAPKRGKGTTADKG